MYRPTTVHEGKVRRVADQVRAHAETGQRVHVSKGGVHHVVPLPGDTRFDTPAVDVSSLNQILSIDPVHRTCVAEPGVTFRELVEATLTHGLIPAVVPELEGITVGGAVAGCSVESMSYRYGGFHDMCLAYELVTGTGEVLECTPDHETELFEMVHGSYGTLAILTKVTFRLVQATSTVKLEYRHYDDIVDFEHNLRTLCKEDEYDFIDAIVHSPRHAVICLGRFVDDAPYRSSYRGTGVYYKSTRTRREDYLSTPDYCFRYDADCHWLTQGIPPLQWPLVRATAGRFLLGSTNLITWSHRIEHLLKLKKRPDVVCDIFIPADTFHDFFHWYEEEFDYFPLWVVPYRPPEIYPWVAPDHAERMRNEDGDLLFFDCAVYGRPNGDEIIDYSELLENKTYHLGGIKTLIGRNHYTEKRFWEIYNQDAYRAAKARLDPNGAFPDLYEKLGSVG
jgi:FAD/FMN-containing dehydrogenase